MQSDNSYNLEQGEFIVLQQSEASLISTDGIDPLEEVVLTNKHLILVANVSEGLFKTSRYLKRIPLEQILNDRGIPCLVVSTVRDENVLNVAFSDDSVTLSFSQGSKSAARRWEASITSAALGDLSDIRSGNEATDAANDFIENAKGAFGGIFGGGRSSSKKKDTPIKVPTTVTTHCISCHAPLVGRKGSVVTCTYCDTKQTL